MVDHQHQMGQLRALPGEERAHGRLGGEVERPVAQGRLDLFDAAGRLADLVPGGQRRGRGDVLSRCRRAGPPADPVVAASEAPGLLDADPEHGVAVGERGERPAQQPGVQGPPDGLPDVPVSRDVRMEPAAGVQGQLDGGEGEGDAVRHGGRGRRGGAEEGGGGVEVSGQLGDRPVLEEEGGGQRPAQLPFELPDEVDGGERVEAEGEKRLVVGDRGVRQTQRRGQQPAEQRRRTAGGVATGSGSRPRTGAGRLCRAGNRAAGIRAGCRGVPRSRDRRRRGPVRHDRRLPERRQVGEQQLGRVDTARRTERRQRGPEGDGPASGARSGGGATACRRPRPGSEGRRHPRPGDRREVHRLPGPARVPFGSGERVEEGVGAGVVAQRSRQAGQHGADGGEHDTDRRVEPVPAQGQREQQSAPGLGGQGLRRLLRAPVAQRAGSHSPRGVEEAVEVAESREERLDVLLHRDIGHPVVDGGAQRAEFLRQPLGETG
ncbi:hypothetical protein SGRI78S_02942 [Streptomyces griseus subsp. griseus]